MTTKELIARGLMTDQSHTYFTQIVTNAGDYQDADTGYWYNVAWKDGQISVSSVGYSARYLVLLKEYEDIHGPVKDRYTDMAFMTWLAQRIA